MKKENCIIDFHAHILPGADHGSRSLETTAEQLSILRSAGVSGVVATPHFYPQNDSVESFLERREKSKEVLASLDREGMPEIFLGAEVLVCAGIDHMPGLEKLCVEGTDVILLEMPFSGWREEHIEAVRKISLAGFVVVMAHIDRYPTKDVVRLSEECDVLYQINGETQKTLGGRKKADSMIRSLPVCAVGSDIHGADKRAARNLVRLYKRLKRSGADMSETTRALLKGAKTI